MASNGKFISSATTLVKQGAAKLKAVVIATTSSGTYALYDNDKGDSSGEQKSGVITPTAGTYIEWKDMYFSKGLSVVVTGTLTFTVVYE